MEESKRLCDVETFQDFCRYYEAGWISATNTPPHRPLYMLGPSRQKQNHAIFQSLIDTETSGIRYAEDVTLDWEFIQKHANFGSPKLGMLLNVDSLVYAASLAERQSHRGVRLGNTYFHQFNDWYTRTKTKDDPKPNDHGRLDLIWQIFNPKYYSLKEAIGLLEKGEFAGVPLSQYLGLYSRPDKLHPILAYKRWTVGYAPSIWQVVLGKRFADYADIFRRILKVDVQVQ